MAVKKYKYFKLPGTIYSNKLPEAMAFKPVGNRLEIPKDFFIHNYSEVKKVMQNFNGKYSNNGFTFAYPAV